jgi:hypothetical protein
MISGMKQLASLVCALALLLVLCGFRSPQLQTETAVIQYQPPTNLPDSGREGYCWTGSIAAPYRRDAWRCTEDNDIHDPCFSLPNGNFVVCGANPVAGDKGFTLRLTKPLPEPERSLTSADTNQAWMVQLSDGETCTPFTGTRPLVAGQVATYGCSPNAAGRSSVLLGDLDNSEPVWKAKAATLVRRGTEWKAASTDTIPVKTVWQ